MKIITSDNKLQLGDGNMSLDESDYKQVKEIKENLSEIKVELKEHNRLMQELIDSIKTLTLCR